MFGLQSRLCFAVFIITLAASVEAGHRKCGCGGNAASVGYGYGTSAGYGYGYNYSGSSYYGGYQNWGAPGYYGGNGWGSAYQYGGTPFFNGSYGQGQFQTGPVVPPVAPGDELVF